MPDYLTRYNGDTDSRLRNTHLDNLSVVSNIASTTTNINNLNKFFFFRSHTLWDSLPFDIRNSMSLLLFKNKLYKHLWNIALTDIEQSEDEWSFQSSDDDGLWIRQNKERHFVRQFWVSAGVLGFGFCFFIDYQHKF